MAAAPSNGNLVEKFEESFQACLNMLTTQEALVDKVEVKVEAEMFIDLARQMEAFFLQKRFLLSATKPELLVKEDNKELKCELQRKEDLLRRTYDKMSQWQSLLADLQGYKVRQGAPMAAQQFSPVTQPCRVVVATKGTSSPAPARIPR